MHSPVCITESKASKIQTHQFSRRRSASFSLPTVGSCWNKRLAAASAHRRLDWMERVLSGLKKRLKDFRKVLSPAARSSSYIRRSVRLRRRRDLKRGSVSAYLLTSPFLSSDANSRSQRLLGEETVEFYLNNEHPGGKAQKNTQGKDRWVKREIGLKQGEPIIGNWTPVNGLHLKAPCDNSDRFLSLFVMDRGRNMKDKAHAHEGRKIPS